MPRLRNRSTGVVVDVSDDTAGRLGGSEWEPADKPAPTPARASSVKPPPKSAAK